jgi:hypothetical protein
MKPNSPCAVARRWEEEGMGKEEGGKLTEKGGKEIKG